MVEIMTSHNVKICPQCNGSDFRKDYTREETYCNTCGLVLQSAFQYVGLEKVENTIPFSAPHSARDGTHYNWIYKEDKGKVNNRKTTRYKHNIPNRKLMIKGHK